MLLYEAAAQVVPAPWLRLFSPGEVNQLLSGGEGGGLVSSVTT